MTLEAARLLQERWKIWKGTNSCKHRRVNDFLTVNNKRATDYFVCLECGTVQVNPKKASSPARVKTLKELMTVNGERTLTDPLL